MRRQLIEKFKAFTMIELMVGIFVTLAAIGTFFKLYTNSIKAERSTNLRSSVALVGDQMIENIANSIRLLGLNNEYIDFNPGVGVPGSIILDSNGGSGTDAISFRFRSPFGGPIAQLSEAATGAGPCTFKIKESGSGAFHTGLMYVNLMANNGIYTGTTVTPISMNGTTVTIVTSALKDRNGADFAGDCATTFPAGTLITGPNNDYSLTYVNGGATTIVKLSNATTGEDIVDFESDANSAYKVPYFVLQFQREYMDGVTMRREWVSEIDETASPVFLQDVKAIRLGFVMLSNVDRTKKKVSTAGLSTTVDYCPFEGMCYALNDINKTAFVFRRVIHIRNFDYLKRNADIVY